MKKTKKKPAARRRTRTRPRTKKPAEVQREAQRIFQATRTLHPHASIAHCSFCQKYSDGKPLDGVKLTVSNDPIPYYFLCLPCARDIGTAANLPKAAAK